MKKMLAFMVGFLLLGFAFAAAQEKTQTRAQEKTQVKTELKAQTKAQVQPGQPLPGTLIQGMRGSAPSARFFTPFS